MACTTLLAVLIGTYCNNDRAVPTSLSASITGACLTTGQATAQATCITNGAYSEVFLENIQSGNVYYLPCAGNGQYDTTAWTTPEFTDGPPCSFWPCQVTSFSLLGWTAQTYCTGQYQNSENHPALTVDGSNYCATMSQCSSTMAFTFGLANGQEPTNPANYFVFQYDCTAANTPGYAMTTDTCASFSQYNQPYVPVQSGHPQHQSQELLSKGGIAGVLIAGLVCIAVGVAVMIPQAREFVMTTGNKMVEQGKGAMARMRGGETPGPGR